MVNESKYFSASGYTKVLNEIFKENIKGKEMVDNSDISGFIKSSGFNKKIRNSSNKSRIKGRAKQNNETSSVWFKIFPG